MQSEFSFVNENPALKAAHRLGQINWRDFYGGVTIKETFAHLTRGDLLGAARALVALFRYVRGRMFVIPWKYRRYVLSGRSTLRPQADSGASTCYKDSRPSKDTWQQIKAGYAAGIGLREIARKMNVPEGTRSGSGKA